MKILEMQELVLSCTYKPNWLVCFVYDCDFQPRPYIQLTVKNSVDSVSRETCEWKSGKVYLSEHMCRQEIVGAVFGLIERAEMHEMREWFRYKGASIYNPHIDPDALVSIAKKKESFNCRTNAMSMDESK